MRLSQEKDLRGINSNAPFKRETRQMDTNGDSDFVVPEERFINTHMSLLQTYLNSLDQILTSLKPVVEKIARNNSIVIMTCNFGQIMLLVNFVCSSKAKGIDLGNVLVFATDIKTLEVTQDLGLTAIYDEAVS